MNNWSSNSSLGPANGSTATGQVSVVATIWGVSSTTNTGPMTSGPGGYHNQSPMHFTGSNNNNNSNSNNVSNNIYGCVPQANHNVNGGSTVATGGYINGNHTSMTTGGGVVIGGHGNNSSLKSQLVNNVPSNYGHRGMAGVGGQPINSSGNSVGGSYMR